MQTFHYNGDDYITCEPSASLLSSRMLQEMVARKDLIGVRVRDGMLCTFPISTPVSWGKCTIHPVRALQTEYESGFAAGKEAGVAQSKIKLQALKAKLTSAIESL